MSWMAVVAPFIVGVVLVFVPGLILVLPLKLRNTDMVGLAPALSVGIIAVSGILAPMVGVPWTIWTPMVLAVALSIAVFLVWKILCRLGVDDFPYRRRGQEIGSVVAANPVARRWFALSDLWFYGAILLGAIFSGYNIITAIGSPLYISQSFDVNFHINAIRFIVDEGNPSSLFVGALSSGEKIPSFYPAAWHDIASLIFVTTNVDIIAVTNLMSALVGGVIWPVSIVYLVHRTFRLPGPVLLASGALSAAFVGFPLMLMDWGVLYPNMLGIALIPVAIVVATQLFNVTETRVISTSLSVLLGLIVCLAIAIAHPNAIMSFILMLVPLFLVLLVIQWRRGINGDISRQRVVASTVGVALMLGIIYILFWKLRPPEAFNWDPTLTQAQAVGEALMNAPMGRMGGWFITILMVTGIVRVLMRKNRYVWLVGAWAFMVYFYIATRSMDWEDGRAWVTGVWYNDAYRLGGLLPIFGVLFGAVGVAYLVRQISVFVSWLMSRRETQNESNLSKTSLAVGLIAVILCVYLGQNSTSMTTYVREVKSRYQIANNTQVSLDEMNVLEAIDDIVPEDNTLVVIPSTGAGLAYAIADREVTERHIFFSGDSDLKIIQQHLDEAKTNPAVCEAVKNKNAYYYLAFDLGGVFQDPESSIAKKYAGLDEVYENGVGEEVYRSGGAVLYKITVCG